MRPTPAKNSHHPLAFLTYVSYTYCMHTSPHTPAGPFAGLRAALEADARGVSPLLLLLLAQLEALFRSWLAQPPAATPAYIAEEDRLPFHLRLRDARRARILSRGGRGRLRIPTWRDRNRGARAIPGRALIPTRPLAARAPPRAEPA